MKKFYKDIQYIDLTHDKAKDLCASNPQFVMSRVDWAGYHFIKDNKYFMLLKSGMCIYCGEVDDPDLEFKINNYHDEDWIIGFRTDDAREVEKGALILDYFLYHKLLYEGQIQDSIHDLLLLDDESDIEDMQFDDTTREAIVDAIPNCLGRIEDTITTNNLEAGDNNEGQENS